MTRGWGSSIAEAARGSAHRNADAAKAGYGWAELFFVSRCGQSLPERPDYYTLSPSPPPPPAPRADPKSHPIFYMAPGPVVGEAVALHFFEPRYKLLVQRAWASDKRFIYCARPPMSGAAQLFNLPLGVEPEGDGCAVVEMEQVELAEDGEADMWGRVTEAVALTDVMIEPGTGGLFSTTTALLSTTAARASTTEAVDEDARETFPPFQSLSVVERNSADAAAIATAIEATIPGSHDMLGSGSAAVDVAASTVTPAYGSTPLARVGYVGSPLHKQKEESASHRLAPPHRSKHGNSFGEVDPIFLMMVYVMLIALATALGYALSALCQTGSKMGSKMKFCPPPQKFVVQMPPPPPSKIVVV